MKNARLLSYSSSTRDTEETKQMLENHDPLSSNSLPHKCFMEVIAINPKHEKRSDLDYTDPNSELIIEDCQVSFLEKYREERGKSFVVEDRTHEYLQKKYTVSNLKEAISHSVKNAGLPSEVATYFEKTLEKEPKRVQYFKSRGLSQDEAYCCALVLSFYTGKPKEGTTTSYDINRRASLQIRSCNDTLQESSTEKQFFATNVFPIMHYMVKALAHIPYYWGSSVRAVNLTEEELARYKVGSIVSWIQFSSSSMGNQVASHFSNRNVYFYLYSLTGRNIKQFSNFKYEEEVLFSPFSTFLVVKKETTGKTTRIYMRQVELGLTEHTLLWVDDRIFDKDWENKEIMETLTSGGLSKSFHIVPKPSTELALAYLNSRFGKYLKENKNFQIMSDMNRPEEYLGKDAGAILLKEAIARGFNHNFIFYTVLIEYVKDAVFRHLGTPKQDNVFIFTKQEEVIQFFLEFLQPREQYTGY